MTQIDPPEKAVPGAPEGRRAETTRSDDRLGALAAAVGGLEARGPAPVHLWNPPYCGEIALRIAADGTWFYEGTPITRPAMVRLFASILRKDPDRFVLVTPVECVAITVDDAPFAAVAMSVEGDRLSFVTNLGDAVEAGPEHPLRFVTAGDGGVKPYVRVRGDLWARLTRSLAIELLERAEERDGVLGLRSGDAWFAVEAA